MRKEGSRGKPNPRPYSIIGTGSGLGSGWDSALGVAASGRPPGSPYGSPYGSSYGNSYGKPPGSLNGLGENYHQRSNSTRSVASRYMENINAESSLNLRRGSVSSLRSIVGADAEQRDSIVSPTNTTAYLKQLSHSGSRYNVDELVDVTEHAEDVVGMKGRIRLQRKETQSENTSFGSRWMDKQRENIQAYEYLCRIGEAKEWIEACINEEIPSIVTLEESLRNGVILAKLTKAFKPHLVKRIYTAKRLQFIHSENINYFFKFLDEVGMPDLFKFELTDLYDKKNIPKVIFCIHALSFILSAEDLAPEINDLVGKLQFTDDEIRKTQKGLDATGVSLPNFNSMNKHFKDSRNNSPIPSREATPEPIPEPVRIPTPPPPKPKELTPQEQVDVIYKKLTDLDALITFQSVSRGSITRYSLFVTKFALRQHRDELTELYSIYRGNEFRKNFKEKLSMNNANNFITSLQSIIRGKKQLKQISKFKKLLNKNNGDITILQSIVRSKKTQKKQQNIIFQLNDNLNENSVISLQSIIRGNKSRKSYNKLISNVNDLKSKDIMVKLDSLIRGINQRSKIRNLKENLSKDKLNILKLQSLIRGIKSRSKFNNLKFNLLKNENEIILLQSIIRRIKQSKKSIKLISNLNQSKNELPIIKLQSLFRANKTRSNQKNLKNKLLNENESIITLQSIFRSTKSRRDVSIIKNNVATTESTITTISSIVRGKKIRSNISKLKKQLSKNSKSISNLQAIIRRIQYIDEFNEFRSLLTNPRISSSILNLQSLSRGAIVRNSQRKLLSELYGDFDTVYEIKSLQSIIRGNFKRSFYSSIIKELKRTFNMSLELQSIARGGLCREALNNLLDSIDMEEYNILQLQSIIRGGIITRNGLIDFHYDLLLNEYEIIELQSIFRGVLIRFGYDLIRDDLNDATSGVILLQSHLRGYLIRKRYNDRMQFFKDNIDKIINLQSYVRARTQGNAYKQLISTTNPPLPTVRKFIHLLNDNDLDFEEEVKLEKGRKEINDDVKKNDELEQYINQLDVKIALLVKNKITLDELIRQHRNNKGFMSSSSNLGNNGSILSLDSSKNNNDFNLKALNKNSRKRLELYQGFFYILQTQPFYFSRLFNLLNSRTMNDKELKEIENLVLVVFNTSNNSFSSVNKTKDDTSTSSIGEFKREEFFFIKLIVSSITEDIKITPELKIFIKNNSTLNFFWIRLFNQLNLKYDKKQYLRGILGPSITMVTEIEELDLESHPLMIYRSLIIKEELNSNLKSIKNPNIPVAKAIQDPDTRVQFVTNLQRLRELTNEFINDIETSIKNMPYYVRYILRETYRSSVRKFTNENEKKHLGVVGGVFATNYLSGIINHPEEYGIGIENDDDSNSNKVSLIFNVNQKKNLSEIGKLLSQLFIMRPFGSENVYLQPLNEFIVGSVDRIERILKKIIDVQDIEDVYQMNSLNDIICTKRPVLYIKSADMFAIHALFGQEIKNMIEKPRWGTDPLNKLINELGSLPNKANEILNLSKFSEIKLDLNPNYYYNNVENSEIINREITINSMFMEAKRCLLYIIQVQNIGSNLVDLLIEQVTPKHEEKYKRILEEENKHDKKRSAYIEGALGDLSKLSYRELKRVALERIIELESFGKLTRKNSFQDILNSMAADIRTKHDRRIQRSEELNKINEILEKLSKKNDYLQLQLKTYNDYIEKSMSNLQVSSSNSKRKNTLKHLLPFTKQYFHLRNLQKMGKVPKFGSYKYSAQNFYDRGILVEISNGTLSNSYYGPQSNGKSLMNPSINSLNSTSPVYLPGQLPKIDFTISSDEVGIFIFSASHGSVQIPGASVRITLDELLNKQYDNVQWMTCFEGMVKFDTNGLLTFIFKKFYGD